MFLEILAIILGLAALIWSADKFVDGAAAVASHYHVPPLVIGMVIVGFGTSAPELVVSASSALDGNPGIALGNAYGSNIANIGLILGFTALLSPIAVHSQVIKKELPILMFVTLVLTWGVWNLDVSRFDAVIMLLVFSGVMAWTIRQGLKHAPDGLSADMEHDLASQAMPLKNAATWLILGIVVLAASSKTLVWGASGVASALGVSDLIIGLTVVAIGTSAPELASSLAALRKNQHDLVLGNVIGSNLFNTLAVVGLAGVIQPMSAPAEVLSRDSVVLIGITLLLFVFCYGFKKPGKIGRIEGGVLLSIFIAYTLWLIYLVVSAN